MDICVTIPEFRRRGAASLSLQWGIDKADEMKAKAFIEASMEGAQLYEKFGFMTRDIMDLKKGDMSDDVEWQKFATEYPLLCRWMERDITNEQNRAWAVSCKFILNIYETKSLKLT